MADHRCSPPPPPIFPSPCAGVMLTAFGAEYICKWLAKHDILASVFQRNVHAEVLKRSHRLLVFLAVNNMFGNKETDMIWGALQVLIALPTRPLCKRLFLWEGRSLCSA